MIQTPPRTIMDVFKSLPEGTLAQVINNQLVMSPAPNSRHQRVVRTIFRQIDSYVLKHALGETFFAPIDVYLDEENVYEPGLVFIANERLHIVQDNIYGAPDLVVEVLSPGTQKFDKKEKKEVYERNGVKEYWIVDPKTRSVIAYTQTGNGFREIPSEPGVIVSALLGTTIHF